MICWRINKYTLTTVHNVDINGFEYRTVMTRRMFSPLNDSQYQRRQPSFIIKLPRTISTFKEDGNTNNKVSMNRIYIFSGDAPIALGQSLNRRSNEGSYLTSSWIEQMKWNYQFLRPFIHYREFQFDLYSINLWNMCVNFKMHIPIYIILVSSYAREDQRKHEKLLLLTVP